MTTDIMIYGADQQAVRRAYLNVYGLRIAAASLGRTFSQIELALRSIGDAFLRGYHYGDRL